jgi:hypothetical protein
VPRACLEKVVMSEKDCAVERGITSGLYPDSLVVVNSPDSVDEVREQARLASGMAGVVDALDIAVEEHTRISTAMLGAAVRASGFINSEVVREAIARSWEFRSCMMSALRSEDARLFCESLAHKELKRKCRLEIFCDDLFYGED